MANPEKENALLKNDLIREMGKIIRIRSPIPSTLNRKKVGQIGTYNLTIGTMTTPFMLGTVSYL
jgi:hypothetical protein